MVNSNLAYQINHSDQPEILINDSPLNWSSVKLSEVIDRNKRLEASVFDVKAKRARNIITTGRYPLITIGETNGLISSYTRGRFKRIWVEKSDFPIYQPSRILDIKPTPDGFISKFTKTNIDALRVHYGQILMTCSGTIGNITYVSKTLNNCIFSHDLLRINCNNPIDAGYLYTYFKSKIGNKILLTNSYGAVITHIEPEHLATIPIPNAPYEIKQKIHNFIVHSYKLRDESNDMIDEATKLLIDELHLPDIHDFKVDSYKKNESIETFNIKLSELDGRVDASYHIPIVNAIIDHMKKYAEEVTTIGDKRISKNVILPGRFKRIYVAKEYGRVFIGGKQLLQLNPTNKKYLSLVHHSDRIKKQLELHENMTLVTCSGTIGKVALVGKHWENWAANQHIIRIVPTDKNIAGYLNVFLASDYGYQLITKFIYGSVVDEIDDNHVRQVAIPLLKNKIIQKKINDLALLANEKRYEAYQLEQQALKIMDEEVIYAK